MFPTNAFDTISQFAQMTQQFREMQRQERMGELVDAFQDQMISAMATRLPDQSDSADHRDVELAQLRAEVEALKKSKKKRKPKSKTKSTP